MGLFWRIFDTFLLFAGLVYIFIRYIGPYFKERELGIRLSVEKAKAERDKAEKFYDESRRNLNEIKKKIEYMKREAVKEAEAEKARIIEEARVSAKKVSEDYLALAKSEIENQKRELYNEALSASFTMAEDIINRELTDEVLSKINNNLLKLSGEAIAE